MHAHLGAPCLMRRRMPRVPHVRATNKAVAGLQQPRMLTLVPRLPRPRPRYCKPSRCAWSAARRAHSPRRQPPSSPEGRCGTRRVRSLAQRGAAGRRCSGAAGALRSAQAGRHLQLLVLPLPERASGTPLTRLGLREPACSMVPSQCLPGCAQGAAVSAPRASSPRSAPVQQAQLRESRTAPRCAA